MLFLRADARLDDLGVGQDDATGYFRPGKLRRRLGIDHIYLDLLGSDLSRGAADLAEHRDQPGFPVLPGAENILADVDEAHEGDAGGTELLHEAVYQPGDAVERPHPVLVARAEDGVADTLQQAVVTSSRTGLEPRDEALGVVGGLALVR